MDSSIWPHSVSAVLWDFDDTLVDSLPARVHALDRVFRDANINHVNPEDFLRNLPKVTLEASLAHLAKILGGPADLFSRYKRIYWTKKPGSLRLYTGVEAVLDHLEQRGVQMAVVTQKARSFEIEGIAAGVWTELEELGITARFQVVIGLDDVSNPKPHPEGVQRALEMLGIPSARALMVGDTMADIQAARAAGCWSCLATWGVPDGEDRSRRANPDLVVAAPSELIRLVG